jgi:hypothetical protein
MAAMTSMAATASTAQEAEWTMAPDLQKTMDDAARSGAAKYGRTDLKANTTIRGLGPITPGAARRWRDVPQTDMVRDAGYPVIPGYRYATSAVVDFDRDGMQDVATMVDDGRNGGVLVRFGGGSRASLVFLSNRRFGNGDGLFAAGANRLLVNIPESRQHVLFQERGIPKVRTIGD